MPLAKRVPLYSEESNFHVLKMTILWLKKNAISVFSGDRKLEKIAFRTGKKVGRSVSFIILCSKHVFVDGEKK
jgi:hypothetical protein